MEPNPWLPDDPDDIDVIVRNVKPSLFEDVEMEEMVIWTLLALVGGLTVLRSIWGFIPSQAPQAIRDSISRLMELAEGGIGADRLEEVGEELRLLIPYSMSLSSGNDDLGELGECLVTTRDMVAKVEWGREGDMEGEEEVGEQLQVLVKSFQSSEALDFFVPKGVQVI